MLRLIPVSFVVEEINCVNSSLLIFLYFLPRKGRNLWVLVVGRSPKEHRIGIPEFKYVANMHGDEVCMWFERVSDVSPKDLPSGLLHSV